MANFRYFHPADNVAPLATVTADTGTEDTSYPLTNATDLSYALIAAPSKLNEMNGAWVFDFGTAQRIDALVLWHNFDAALSVEFQGHTANSWTSPSLSGTVVIPAKYADDHTVKVHLDLTTLAGSPSGYTTTGYRYWRLLVGGPSENNSVPVGMKILLFSQIRQTTRNIRWGWSRDLVTTGVKMSTAARVRWAYDLDAAGRLLTAEIPGDDSDVPAIHEWVRACAGFVKPTVIIPNPAVNDAWLVYLDEDAGPITPTLATLTVGAPYTFYQLNPLRLRAVEVTAGDPEWY